MSEEELTRLKAHRDAWPHPTPAAWQEARAALASAIEREDLASSGDSVSSDRSGRQKVGARRWRSRVAIALAAAVVAVAIAAVLRSGAPAAPPPAAAKVLARLAAVAEAQPTPAAERPTAGNYGYIRTQSTDAMVFVGVKGKNSCTLLVQKNRETWIARNRSGLRRETVGSPRVISKANDAACAPVLADPSFWKSYKPEETVSSRDCWFEMYTAKRLPKLPTDPAVLRAQLETGAIDPGDARGPGVAFTRVGDLLRNTEARPALRAALYRAAAGLAGVSSLGEVTDQEGRRGVALAVVYNRLRYELIFNPRTSALLAERDTVASPQSEFRAPVGTVVEEAAYWPITTVPSLPSKSSARANGAATFRLERVHGSCQRAPVAPLSG
jgi:hypothetical protein